MIIICCIIYKYKNNYNNYTYTHIKCFIMQMHNIGENRKNNKYEYTRVTRHSLTSTIRPRTKI